MTIMFRPRMLWSAPLLIGAGILAGCDLISDGDFRFMTPGDNTAACQTISPGDEIAARVAYRGKATKLSWVAQSAELDQSTDVVQLTLVAISPADGFVLGDSSGRLDMILTREEGIALGDYIDTNFVANQELQTFEVKLSSSPSVDAESIEMATGLAIVTEFVRTGNELRIRVAFRVTVLNRVTASVEDICGEGFFNGTVTIIE
ncbi:MAG: hypothetical protein V3T70_06940 [Phycisphaerae bacterium]